MVENYVKIDVNDPNANFDDKIAQSCEMLTQAVEMDIIYELLQMGVVVNNINLKAGLRFKGASENSSIDVVGIRTASLFGKHFYSFSSYYEEPSENKYENYDSTKFHTQRSTKNDKLYFCDFMEKIFKIVKYEHKEDFDNEAFWSCLLEMEICKENNFQTGYKIFGVYYNKYVNLSYSQFNIDISNPDKTRIMLLQNMEF